MKVLFKIICVICMGFVCHNASGMEIRELYIESKFDKLPISALEVVPDQKPHAVVYMVHGLCGCKERFLPFMEFLAANGIACVASDHRGHGSSILKEEDRGYMYGGGVQAVVMDMDAVVDHIRKQYQDLPLVMVGHSMGSLAARSYMKSHDARLDALVLCGSPSPNPLAPVGGLIMRGLRVVKDGRMRVGSIQKFTSRRYNKSFRDEGQQAWTCSDPEVRRAFAEDARCNFVLTVDCASTLLGLFRDAYSHKDWALEKPSMPVIFLSGDDDPCMITKEKFLKSVDRMRKNGYTDVRCQTYPGMRHEILNERDRLVVWQDILKFINEIL